MKMKINIPYIYVCNLFLINKNKNLFQNMKIISSIIKNISFK